MVKKKTSIIVDNELWIRVKLHCVACNKRVSDFVEELLRKEIG